MLKNLHIENIAVIERADIMFEPGFSVLSGETGAGKSIIIDSINAVLGNRTSKDIVRTGADYSLVSAVFDSKNIESWLEENDITYDDEVILQRKITADGKSTCRISGIPVTASQLRDIASMLIDIHGQNDGLRLLDERSHLQYLDDYGTDESVYKAYKSAFDDYCAIKKEIDSLYMDENEKIHLAETLKSTISELEKADIHLNEYDSLISKRDLMRNSEKLREALASAMEFLSSGDNNACSCSENALYYVSRAAAFMPQLEETVSDLKDAVFKLKNASEVIDDMCSDINFSEGDYDELEARISLLTRLQKKYKCNEEELITLIDESKKKLDDIYYSDERIVKLRKQLKTQETVCLDYAKKLSDSRKKAAENLEKRIISELNDLNMKSVKFKVNFETTELTKTGYDGVSFLMSANAGENLGRISKIASGGELSRIMLALKNVFAEHDIVDTMIFDEIDAGVSGISAQRVAEKLWNVSRDKQVMCISHLPQIASMADNEYLVYKQEKNNRTFTEVLLLDVQGRKKEIARMYGGDNISELTLEAAQEQLEKAEKYKNEHIG